MSVSSLGEASMPSKLAKDRRRLTYIREVLSLNLGRHTDCDQFFFFFGNVPQPLLLNAGMVPQVRPRSSSFHILSSRLTGRPSQDESELIPYIWASCSTHIGRRDMAALHIATTRQHLKTDKAIIQSADLCEVATVDVVVFHVHGSVVASAVTWFHPCRVLLVEPSEEYRLRPPMFHAGRVVECHRSGADISTQHDRRLSTDQELSTQQGSVMLP
jgi:hypothetical protein